MKKYFVYFKYNFIFSEYIQENYINISEFTYIMTNITLAIKDETYKKMKKYSEISWSEFVRKQIEQRIQELESIESKESIYSMLASEHALKKEWINEEDERWNDV